MAVEAQLDLQPKKGRRGSARRELRLRVRGTPAAGDPTDVLVHNLSASGLLLETSTKLAIGSKIVVDLPETARSLATVVWESGRFFGCTFDHPLSAAAVSAAQLRSEPAVQSLSTAAPPGPEASQLSSESFGDRLRQLRKEKGLSLVEFAHRMKVSRPTVWSWEAGKSAPRASKVARLLDVIGVTMEELYGASEGPSPPAIDAKSAQDDAVRAVISEAKERVAMVVGTDPDKVTLIIEI